MKLIVKAHLENTKYRDNVSREFFLI